MEGQFAAIRGRDGIQKKVRAGRNVMVIDSEKVQFHGIPAKQLSGYGRRKLENLFYLENPKESLIFKYTDLGYE